MMALIILLAVGCVVFAALAMRRTLELNKADAELASVKGLLVMQTDANEVLAKEAARKVGKRESEKVGIRSAVVTAERPLWEQSDAEAMRAWLATPAGRKFSGILLFDEQTQNRSAVLRITNHEYNAGFAAGFHARSESILTLSADVRPQQDEDSGERDGATPLAERHAP